jgi:hypothetical protein
MIQTILFPLPNLSLTHPFDSDLFSRVSHVSPFLFPHSVLLLLTPYTPFPIWLWLGFPHMYEAVPLPVYKTLELLP